jgi:hypothetical protein
MLHAVTSRHRTLRAALVAILAALPLAACGASEESDGGQAAAALESAAPAAGTPGALPTGHVHGVAVNPADGRVVLATHHGLFRYTDAGPERVGPEIDLMGFTVAGPDRFYASGHPGPGVDLPQPLGLVESTDGGRTWTVRSRGGESDFHALTASAAGVLGFDGRLRASTDGTSWRELDPPSAPYALGASPDGKTVLATTTEGLLRSTDGGAAWAPVESAPLIQLVDWADDRTAVGVAPDGGVWVSEDGGKTWAEREGAGGPPQALGAERADSGALHVYVVTLTALVHSADGAAFAPYKTG